MIYRENVAILGGPCSQPIQEWHLQNLSTENPKRTHCICKSGSRLGIWLPIRGIAQGPGTRFPRGEKYWELQKTVASTSIKTEIEATKLLMRDKVGSHASRTLGFIYFPEYRPEFRYDVPFVTKARRSRKVFKNIRHVRVRRQY
jgi:hypothetical protein